MCLAIPSAWRVWQLRRVKLWMKPRNSVHRSVNTGAAWYVKCMCVRKSRGTKKREREWDREDILGQREREWVRETERDGKRDTEGGREMGSWKIFLSECPKTGMHERKKWERDVWNSGFCLCKHDSLLMKMILFLQWGLQSHHSNAATRNKDLKVSGDGLKAHSAVALRQK